MQACKAEETVSERNRHVRVWGGPRRLSLCLALLGCG